MVIEKRHTEYRLSVTSDFLKTVSAFANYGGGQIYFGVLKDGTICGIQNPVETAVNLEDQIRNNIVPVPVFRITIHEGDILLLDIQSGRQTPYCYQGKAYKRNNTSTMPVNADELSSLILKGRNQSVLDLPSKEQNLTFETFNRCFQDRFGLQTVFPDTFVTLELYSEKEGFNNAAALLSDQNPFPGIDIVMYGQNHSQIRSRKRLENQSVLDLLDGCIKEFESRYLYEEITLRGRVTQEKIPSEAFRELIASAFVHRDWQLPARIKIEMEEDAVSVTFPGFLPDEMTRQEYLTNLHIPVLRNKSLALIFLKLRKIEHLGSVLPMILEEYRKVLKKPEFIAEDNFLSVSLPVTEQSLPNSPEQQKVLDLVRLMQPVSAGRLLKQTRFSRSTQLRILNHLMEQGLIRKAGNGRTTQYLLCS